MKKVAAANGFLYSDLPRWYDVTIEKIMKCGGTGLVTLADSDLEAVRQGNCDVSPLSLPPVAYLIAFANRF